MIVKRVLSFPLLVMFFSCGSPGREGEKNTKVELRADTFKWEKGYTNPSATPDSAELKKFWAECVTPFIVPDREKIRSCVYFPLDGDWGHMMELDKPKEEWAEKDFMDNMDKVFTPEFVARLKTQSHRDVEVFKQADGEINLLVSVGFEQVIDGFKDESSVILRYKKINDAWKLYVIFGAG